jgi:hypothetical protein
VRVGEPIAIDAKLNALVQALGGAGTAGADMLRTLRFSLAPAPGFEGATIAYESAPPPAPADTVREQLQALAAKVLPPKLAALVQRALAALDLRRHKALVCLALDALKRTSLAADARRIQAALGC